jgi:hypothetical protein
MIKLAQSRRYYGEMDEIVSNKGVYLSKYNHKNIDKISKPSKNCFAQLKMENHALK